MKKIWSYIINFVIGISISLAIMLSKNVFKQVSSSEVMHILCDSFFVPGILILGFGLLVVASNGGTFDMLIYGTKKFFDLFRKPQYRKITNTFYDYRRAKEEHPGEFLYLVLVGLGFIIVSLIFLIFYYQV